MAAQPTEAELMQFFSATENHSADACATLLAIIVRLCQENARLTEDLGRARKKSKPSAPKHHHKDLKSPHSATPPSQSPQPPAGESLSMNNDEK